MKLKNVWQPQARDTREAGSNGFDKDIRLNSVEALTTRLGDGRIGKVTSFSI